MSKLRLPCVACATSIYTEADIAPETVICASCKRQGGGICPKCGCRITAENTRKKSTKCASCYLEWHKANEARKAQREQEAKAKAVVAAPKYATDDDMTFPDTAVFGGLEWGSAAVNPVG